MTKSLMLFLIGVAFPAIAFAQGAPSPRPDAGAATPAVAPGATPAQDRKIVIPDAPKLPYHLVQAPTLPAGAPIGNVTSVQLTRDGTLYSYQRVNPALIKWGKNGKMVAGYLNDVIARAHGMRIDPNGRDLWLADQNNNVVLKVDSKGKILMTLGTSGQTGTWDEAAGKHLFNQPTDIGFGPNGDIFVSTGHGGPDPRIVRFDKNGKFIKTWPLTHDDGTSANLHTLVVNKKGEIYVGDREVKRIRVYDMDGRHLRDIQMQNLLCGLYIAADGGLWMTTGEDGMIMNIDWNGKILGWFGKAANPPGLPGEFGEAHYMTITPDMKTIYVADSQLNRITELKHD